VSVNKSLYWRSRRTVRHAAGHPACQVRRAGAGVHGAVPPRLGCHRSPGDRLRWHRAGGAGHGDGRVDDPARAARSAGASARAAVVRVADASGRPSPTRHSCGTRWWSPRLPLLSTTRGETGLRGARLSCDAFCARTPCRLWKTLRTPAGSCGEHTRGRPTYRALFRGQLTALPVSVHNAEVGSTRLLPSINFPTRWRPRRSR
jgi:hypothetical protein